MKKFTILVVTALIGLLAPIDAVSRSREQCRAEVLSRSHGFYKDIFMDGGINLTSRVHLPAARFLGASIDYFASAKNEELTAADTLYQRNIFCGYEEDTNGWLLYPDGAPRFRVIYVNGGTASLHARTLTDEGRANLRKFIAAGGSYVGTCAGAYLGTSGNMAKSGLRHTDLYLCLYPGYARFTGLRKSKTAMAIEGKSPLLRYFDFGGDKSVEGVIHNGGCYAYVGDNKSLPEGTEVLSRYSFSDTDKVKIDGKVSAWAYKASAQSGRVVLCGSHPEGVVQGEKLEYMSAMVLYAMDGNPQPEVKGLLQEGEVREMNRRTEDNDPLYTRIGDRQYHHFALDVPKGCKRVVVSLEGYKGENKFDLTLSAKRGELAFHDNTLLKVVSRGCKKRLNIDAPKAGRWYVSVLCENTVTATTSKYGTQYSGCVAVLNGVPYQISVKYVMYE